MIVTVTDYRIKRTRKAAAALPEPASVDTLKLDALTREQTKRAMQSWGERVAGWDANADGSETAQFFKRSTAPGVNWDTLVVVTIAG